MADTLNMPEGIFKPEGYGIGGINGMHHDVMGWDNTTVGMASSVFDNLLSQNGVRTNDPNYIGALEPIRTGKFIVKWLKVPAFFDPVAVKYLKFFLENAVKQVEGINDNSIATSGTVSFGANGQEMDFPGQYKESNKGVTLTTVTCTGDGLGKLLRYWQYGITDPQTQVHHMYGKDLRFIRPNYSGTLIYIFLGPTARPGDIEYACLWHEVWPSGPDGKTKFNSGEIGNDSAVGDQSVELTGIFQDGPEVNILAKYIVAASGLAGQSYFDQMLPGYMYTKYISNIKDKNADVISSVSVTQDNKIKAMTALDPALGGITEPYNMDILESGKGIRSEVISKYGLESEKYPSKQPTLQPDGLVDSVTSFAKEVYKDPTQK